MTSQTRTGRAASKGRTTPLTRERALFAAMELADRGGLEELSMRRLAEALGVEAMSLYHHVPNKSAILDGMVDLVFEEMREPIVGRPWRAELHARTVSMREVLLKHRWALRVLESRRAPGPLTLAHHDAVLGCLRAGGFSIPLAARAYALLDSFVFGFVHTELTLPFEGEAQTREVAHDIFAALPPGAFPHLVEFTREYVMLPGYAFANEFLPGLDLVLESLERALADERRVARAKERQRPSAARKKT